MANDLGLPAFPLPFAALGEFEYQGLTKRELLAAMAMQGLLAHGKLESFQGAAKMAVDQADALLSALDGYGET